MKKIFLFLVLSSLSLAQSGKDVFTPNQLNVIKDSLDAVRTLIGTGGVALPDSVIYESEMTDSLNVIRGSYVDKTTAQTITGQKNFLNNKTVFGTTTNDSVRIRGDIIIDGRFYIVGGTGDVNEDGGIYGEDRDIVANYLNGNSTLTKSEWMTADINGDGNVDWADYHILGFIQGEEIPFGATYLFKKENGIRSANNFRWKSSLGNFTVDGSLVVEDSLKYNNMLFPVTDGNVGQTIKTNGNGIFYWGDDNTGTGGSAYADSLVKDGVTISGNDYATESQIPDSVLKVSGSSYKLSYTGANINSWIGALQNTTTGVIRLGNSYNDKRFNISAYTDVWNIDYVIPPYNLSATWLYPIEHRTDYYNDTLQTTSGIFNSFNVDGIGTPIWRSSSTVIGGNHTNINFGDLPDSVGLNLSTSYAFGNRVQVGENNKTATPTRFPMPFRMYTGDIDPGANYTYPSFTFYYSDLTNVNADYKYHFYGNGNYPSYFGGNILTDGYLKVQDSIIIGTSTVKIYPDSITIGGTRVAKITETVSGTDSLTVNNLIQDWADSTGSTLIATAETLDSLVLAFWNGTLGSDTTGLWSAVNSIISGSGVTLIGTSATLDSIVTAFWNGSLGGSITITYPDANTIAFGGDAINLDPTTLEMNGFDQLTVVGGGSTFDSTYVYQRITALEDSISALRYTLNAILVTLDSLGYSPDLTDNTPPLPPSSFVAIGGTATDEFVSTWTDPVDADLSKIYWYESSANDSTTLALVDSINAGVQTYTRTGRTANTTYWSAIKGRDAAGNLSYFSNRDSATTLPTAGVTPIATLDFEEGNLTDWSSTSGANLTASTTFAHSGTYSMRVGTNSYGLYNFTSDTEVWLTFWIYLPSTSSQNANYNYISMYGNGVADRTCFGTNNGTWSEWIAGTTSGNMTDGDFTTNFSQNVWHKVKMYYQTNGTTTSNHQVWVDNTSIWSSTGAFTNSVGNFSVGSEAATITNWFYIDDIKLYDVDPGTQD